MNLPTTNNLIFLNNRNEDIYMKNIIKQSIQSVKQCLNDNKQLIEIEFPPSRSSDISVGETLANNRIFVRQFIKNWENIG